MHHLNSTFVNHLECVISTSANAEKFLEANFDAAGKDLSEKIFSVENQLSENTVRHLRRIASTRDFFDEGAIDKQIHDWDRFEESVIYLLGIIRLTRSEAESREQCDSVATGSPEYLYN